MKTSKNEKSAPPGLPWFLQRRGLIAALIAAFVLLFAAAVFLCHGHYQATRARYLQSNEAAAGLLSLLIEEHFLMITTTMEAYASRPLLQKAVRDKSAEKSKPHLLDMAQKTPGVDALSIYDKHGVLWFRMHAAPEALGKSFAFRDWYRGVSEQWQPYVSAAFLRVVDQNDAAVAAAVPVFDQGEVIGIIVNSVSLSELGKFIARFHLEQGQSLAVADQGGNLVYSNRVGNYSKRITPYAFYEAARRAKTAASPTAAVYDPAGEAAKYYISFAPVERFGWSVFVEQQSRSIWLAEINYYIQTTAIAGLLFSLFAVVLVYFRRRTVAQQLLDELHQEAQLREKDIKYRELFDSMTSGVAVYRAENDGEDFTILEMNRAGQRITGVYENFAGRYVGDVFPGIKDFGLFEVFRQVWKTGLPAHHPVSLYQDERLGFWVENYVYKLPTGEIVAIFDDVTERKKAEEALGESEARYRSLFENATEGIYQSTPQGRYLMVNPELARMFGFASPEEMIAQVTDIGSQIYADPQDRKRFLEAVAAEGRIRNFEFEACRKDGSRLWISSSTRAVRDESGAILYFEGTNIDITERKRAQEKLDEQLAELRRWHEATLGRETRILELKREVNDLLAQAGLPPRYASAKGEDDDGKSAQKNGR